MTKKIASPAKKKTTLVTDLDDLDFADSSESQDIIDHSLTRDFEGIGPTIAGVSLRPLSMSAIMRLYEVGNEIMGGKQVKDMHNPLYSALEFLYMLDESNDSKDVSRKAFGPRIEWRVAVSVWGEEVEMSDMVVSEVINFINDSTSSRVNATLRDSMKSDVMEEDLGNE